MLTTRISKATLVFLYLSFAVQDNLATIHATKIVDDQGRQTNGGLLGKITQWLPEEAWKKAAVAVGVIGVPAVLLIGGGMWRHFKNGKGGVNDAEKRREEQNRAAVQDPNPSDLSLANQSQDPDNKAGDPEQDAVDEKDPAAQSQNLGQGKVVPAESSPVQVQKRPKVRGEEGPAQKPTVEEQVEERPSQEPKAAESASDVPEQQSQPENPVPASSSIQVNDAVSPNQQPKATEVTDRPKRDLPSKAAEIQDKQISHLQKLHNLMRLPPNELNQLCSNEKEKATVCDQAKDWVAEAFVGMSPGDLSEPGVIKGKAEQLAAAIGNNVDALQEPAKRLKLQLLEEVKCQTQAAVEKGLNHLSWLPRVNECVVGNELEFIAGITPHSEHCSKECKRVLKSRIDAILNPIVEQAKQDMQNGFGDGGQLERSLAAVERIAAAKNALGDATAHSDLYHVAPADMLFDMMDNAPCFAQQSPEQRRFIALTHPQFQSEWVSKLPGLDLNQCKTQHEIQTAKCLRKIAEQSLLNNESIQLPKNFKNSGAKILLAMAGLSPLNENAVLGKSWENIDPLFWGKLNKFYQSISAVQVQQLERICGHKLPRPPKKIN